MQRRFLKRKKYSNPFLPQKTKKDAFMARRIKRIFFVVCLVCLLLGLVYAIIYSPLLRVDKIVVTDVKKIELLNKLQSVIKREIEGNKFIILPRDNLLFLNVGKLEEMVKLRVVVDELKIRKKLPQTLKVSALDKLPVLIWNEGKDYFYIDKFGLAMKAVPFERIEYDLPYINRGTTTQIIIGRKVIGVGDINFIKNVLSKVKDNFSDWRIVQLVAKQFNNNQIYFYTNEGWYLILDKQTDIDKSFEHLRKLLEQKIVDRSKLLYIDLRIKDKIFYQEKK